MENYCIVDRVAKRLTDPPCMVYILQISHVCKWNGMLWRSSEKAKQFTHRLARVSQ